MRNRATVNIEKEEKKNETYMIRINQGRKGIK